MFIRLNVSLLPDCMQLIVYLLICIDQTTVKPLIGEENYTYFCYNGAR